MLYLKQLQYKPVETLYEPNTLERPLGKPATIATEGVKVRFEDGVLVVCKTPSRKVEKAPVDEL